ncbi:MAG: hypothetical protein NC131_13595 [Roseburia sp.]|nr:hypothetical protein [Roseburia sp.]
MSNYELRKHKTSDLIKWAITAIVGLALIAAVIGLAVKLDRQTSTTTIGGEAYIIGTLDEETGLGADGDTSIVLRKSITTDGLKCVPSKNAEISYRLFFYDIEGKFISSTEAMTEAFNGGVPAGADSVKVLITPTADTDGKVSIVEVLGYAGMLTVTVNK